MSSEWPLVALEDLTDGTTITYGVVKPGDESDDGVLFIRGGDVVAGQIQQSQLRTISREVSNQYSRTLLRGGELLISLVGNPGEVALVPTTLKGANIARQVGLLRIDSSKADPNYIQFFFRSKIGRDVLLAHSKGSVQQVINLKDLKAVKIPLPELSAQRSIAASMQVLDDRITLLRETNTTLEAIAQALFKSWFVDFDPVHAKMQGRAPEGMIDATAALFPDSFEESELGPMPKGWRVERLGDVVERVTKGTTPTTLKRPFVEKGINFVKAESMTDDGGFLPEKFAYIDDETHELLKRSQLQDGDVLISIAGTIGRSAVITEDFLPANTNQAVALIRPKQEVFPSGLLWRFLKQENSMQLMGERVVQAVQANLSLGTLSDIRLVLPPKGLTMKLFEIAFSAIDESKALNSQKVRVLSVSRDTLLPRLISGQLQLPEVG